jgi:CHAT domain-containing protein
VKQATLDKARALQQAQVALASRPETRHPFFWAPFILIGDWR